MWAEIGEFFSQNDELFRLLLIALAVCALFWIVGIVLARKVGPGLEKRLDADKHPVAVQLLQGFRRPVSLFMKIAGICVGLLIVAAWQPVDVPVGLSRFVAALPPFLNKALRITAILAVTWGLVSSSGISGVLLRNARNRLDLHMSKSVTRFLSAIFNVVVVAIAAVILLSELNYDINGLIAGLGLGGLTIALAAKDSAANFFGGLVLVLEKPFEIGDWIACDGAEGTVEDINLRSTKIRTSAGSLTIVPNANLSASAITNWSGSMKKRRASFLLQLTYGTTRKQIQDYTAAVRTMLETDPEVITDSVVVRFSEFGDSSLNIQVVFYTSLPGYGDHLRIKERVNYALMELAQQTGVSFAFPTRTLYIQDKRGAPGQPATAAVVEAGGPSPNQEE